MNPSTFYCFACDQLVKGLPENHLRVHRRVIEVAKLPATECWLWQWRISDQGYGHLSILRRNWLVHRYMYELLVGPIPEGKELDHLCRVTRCVNPAHLEPVTRSQNELRKIRPGACHRGHPFNAANTYTTPVQHACRVCRRMMSRWKREGVAA